MVTSMQNFTKEALEMMYHEIPEEKDLPDGIQKFRVVKTIFEAYLSGVLENVHDLTESKYFEEYLAYYRTYIYVKPKKHDDGEILRTHNSHFLDRAFNALKTKENITGNIEYCTIKLAASSGMTEYTSAVDLLTLHSFFDDMCR